MLDQLRAADAEAAVAGITGTFVSKVIRDRTYWYEQRSEGATKRQIYLGAESPELLAHIKAASERRLIRESDERRRRELVTMLAAGGMFRESAAIGVVLRVLADASVFRCGGVLIGTQAFTCIANMLGVTFEKQSLRTADVDVAHDSSIPLGLTERADTEMLERLRLPSTSFRVRGRDLRIDFLTPVDERSRSTKPVFLPHLGVAAQPLHGLDYLIESTVDAAVVVGSGVHVNVPLPARFAFHKLWVSKQRPAAEAAKARKDIRQAEQILEVLSALRPADIRSAWEAARSRVRRDIKASLNLVDAPIRSSIESLIRGKA